MKKTILLITMILLLTNTTIGKDSSAVWVRPLTTSYLIIDSSLNLSGYNLSVDNIFVSGGVFNVTTYNINVTGDIYATGVISGNTSQWNRSGTNVVLANTGDNVGVGTSTPNTTLTIESSGVNEGLMVKREGVAGYTLFDLNAGGAGRFRLWDSTGKLGYSFVASGASLFNGTTVSFNDVNGDIIQYIDGDTGEVGIGTETPVKKLHLNSSELSTSLLITNYNTSTSTTTEGSPYFLTPRTSSLILGNNNSEFAFQIRGNDANPEFIDSFQVYSPTYNKAPIIFESPSAYGGRYNSFFISNEGDVGLGTSNPSAILDVVTQTQWSGMVLRGTNTPNFNIQYSGNVRLKQACSSDGTCKIATHGDAPIVFYYSAGTYYAAADEVFRIDRVSGKDIIDFYADGDGVVFGAGDDNLISGNGNNLVLNASYGGTNNLVIDADSTLVSNDLSVTGNATYNSYYGQIYGSHIGDISLSANDVYYNITNMTEGLTNGFIFNNSGVGGLTPVISGIYQIRAHYSFSGTASKEYHIRASKNANTSLNGCHAERVIGSGGDVGSASFNCLASLTPSDFVNLQIETSNGATSVTIHDIDMDIIRVGG